MVDVLAISKRLQAEARWAEIEPLRNQMMKEARKVKGLLKHEAQQWVYGELDRLYPPLPPPPEPEPEPVDITQTGDINMMTGNVTADDTAESLSSPGEPLTHTLAGVILGQVQPADSLVGLWSIPGDWPPLPPNAQLQLELSWVQSERLRIVEEKAGGSTVVHLDRASVPAPSQSALAWLETAIRSYAKYVDVCARVLAGSPADESESARRERLAIIECRDLLSQV